MKRLLLRLQYHRQQKPCLRRKLRRSMPLPRKRVEKLRRKRVWPDHPVNYKVNYKKYYKKWRRLRRYWRNFQKERLCLTLPRL